MLITAKTYVKHAAHYVGYREKNSADDLETFGGWNVGNRNFQKFQPLCNAGNGDQWCQYFDGGVAVEACGSIEDAQKLLWMPKKSYMTGYTPDGKQAFVDAGQWYTKPKVGDIVYFYVASKGRVGHTGIVEWVDTSTKRFGTIEGNTSSTVFNDNGGCVARHTYLYTVVGGKNRVNGFGRPRFLKEADVTKQTTQENKTMGVKNPEEFVRMVYAAVLGRTVDDGGLQTWTGALQNGVDPTDVLFGITNSEEGSNRLIGHAYKDLLGRYARPDEIEAWKTLPIDRVIEKIKSSEEYKALHNPSKNES